MGILNLKFFRSPTLDENIERFEQLSSSKTLVNSQQKELERLTSHLQSRYIRLSTARVFEGKKIFSFFSEGLPIDVYAKTKPQDPDVVEYLKLQEVLIKYGLLPPNTSQDMVKTESSTPYGK